MLLPQNVLFGTIRLICIMLPLRKAKVSKKGWKPGKEKEETCMCIVTIILTFKQMILSQLWCVGNRERTISWSWWEYRKEKCWQVAGIDGHFILSYQCKWEDSRGNLWRWLISHAQWHGKVCNVLSCFSQL